MKTEIICVGELKESYLREAESEYLKRLAPYCKTGITSVRETRLPKGESGAEKEAVRTQEGKELLAAAGKQNGAYIVALDMRGQQKTSEEFVAMIEELPHVGKAALVFLIGGSLGLSDEVKKKADAVLSFSEMTFPHQLMRIILLEQLYRAQKILRGEPYHK